MVLLLNSLVRCVPHGMTLSLHPSVDCLSGLPAALSSGVSITRQQRISLDASTRSFLRGTSMSISF